MRALLTLALLAAPIPAFAQAGSVEFTPELDPDRFVLTSDPHAIGLTDGARPLGKREFSLGMALRVGAPPLQVCAQDGTGKCAATGDVVSTRFGTDLVGAVGLGKLGIYAQLPVVLYQGSDFDVRDGSELAVAGIGDLRLGGKLLVYDRERAAIAFDVRGTIPTGQGDDFTGDGGTTLEGRVIVEHREGKIGVAAQAGYAWRQHPSKLGTLYVDDEILWSVAGEYAVTSKVAAGVAVFGRIGVMTDPDPMTGGSPGWEERPIETMGSARYRVTPQLVVEAGAGAGLDSGYGAPAFRALLGVRYFKERPADLDPDRDHILTPVDNCPTEPEDYDGFEDREGCPDPDNDKDKIVDKVDRCPNDAEDVDKFEDIDGCPEPDNDKDGILDKVDSCPNDAEDVDQFEDVDGCPEPDNDKDGILDKVDPCPLVPEDVDQFEDTDGCPEPDNDKDGIVDLSDKCPLEPETYNGIDDADGCPDAKATVVVTQTQIEIKETIYFDLDKATIKPISFPLLDGVAAALTAHATLKISIEGHTDDLANDDYNLKLSQRRAEAVRDYLIKKGIAADRLVAVGFGETRPKVKATTKAARDQNRRVEFVITNPNGAPEVPTLPAPPAP